MPLQSKVYHYEVLGVPPCADLPTIQAAFKALGKLYHPDTNGAIYATRFSAITTSYNVLKNHALRAKYDAEFKLTERLCGKCNGAGMCAHAKGFGEQVIRLCAGCKGTGREA